MVKNILLAAASVVLICTTAFADRFVNLTPAPAYITVGDGDFKIPEGMKISTKGISNDMRAEVTRFIKDFNEATGLKVKHAEKGWM